MKSFHHSKVPLIRLDICPGVYRLKSLFGVFISLSPSETGTLRPGMLGYLEILGAGNLQLVSTLNSLAPEGTSIGIRPRSAQIAVSVQCRLGVSNSVAPTSQGQSYLKWQVFRTNLMGLDIKDYSKRELFGRAGTS